MPGGRLGRRLDYTRDPTTFRISVLCIKQGSCYVFGRFWNEFYHGTLRIFLSTNLIYWNKDYLAQRLCHALNTAEQAIHRLAGNGYSNSKEQSVNVRPEKVISETAFLLLAASSAGHISEVSARVQSVARQLAPYARSRRMLLGVCLEPSLALDYAQAHVCLTKLGYPDICFDEVLRQSINSQSGTGRERPPHRMLEQSWVMTLWNPSAKRDRSVVRTSALGVPMDLLNGNREDIYAFTHALMYESDFGTRPRRLPRQKAVILAEAEAALARCLDEQDYDLGGEVLLSWPLTGRSWSSAATFGFRVLAGVADKAGFLPSPVTRIKRLDSLQGDERANYLLASAYHTVYVMGLLSAASLQSGRLPPRNISTRSIRKGASSPILKLLDADKQTAHWREELNLLSDQEQDAVTGLLLAVALRRKTREHEFGAVRELLEIGHTFDLTNTPVASQAAEMLERLATFSACNSEKTRT
jgi:hypothetical protein